jgi:hypothetical protein
MTHTPRSTLPTTSNAMTEISTTMISAPAHQDTRRVLARSRLTVMACAVALLGALGAGPAVARAAFGDNFGVAPINVPGAQASVAYPGQHAFWAGACDRSSAPAPPAAGDPPNPIPGGVGGIAATVSAPNGQGSPLVDVPAPPVPQHCIDWGGVGIGNNPPDWNTTDIWNVAPAWRLAPVTAAGARPDGSATMWLRKTGVSWDGTIDNVAVELPAGFVGNPNAATKCTAAQFAVRPLQCPPSSQVGVLQLFMEGSATGDNLPGQKYEDISAVYNLEPRKGNAAEFGFGYASGQTGEQGQGVTTVRIVAKPRTSGDFGVTAFTGQIPAALPVYSQAITIWGVPWERANDVWRAPEGMFDDAAHPCKAQPGTSVGRATRLPQSGLIESCRVGYDRSWGPIRPMLSNETDCNPNPVTRLAIDAYQTPGPFSDLGLPLLAGHPSSGNWEVYDSPSPAVTDCASLDFAPDVAFSPTSSAADDASGLDVGLSIPQKNEPPIAVPGPGASQGQVDAYVAAATAYWKSPAGRATAHLKDTVVTLPAGVSVNPSGATGLTGCEDAVVGVTRQGSPPLFDNSDPTDGLGGDDCPDGSKIATASVVTPLLDEPLTGDVVLGTPKSTDPQSGEMLRMFLILRSKERGLLAKIYGSAVADPATGRITATFANNPELPFERLALQFKGGQRGLLATPQRCGNPAWTTSLTPWSAVGANTPVANTVDGGAFAIDQNCANAFNPGLQAGMDTSSARGSGTFSFRFTRNGGDQYVRGLTAQLPKGLLASVKDVPLCSNAAANAGACPAGSKIGIVDAKAGAGDPFVLEEKGEVFLTEGYNGGAYGLAVKIRPIAGPFRGAMELSPIIVRQAIHVDRKTAQVTAISDPLPLIHHGVPLRVREVTVLVNRGGFMLNPSDCAAKQVAANLTSDQGATAHPTNAFQANNCSNLAFKPKLALRLTGRKQVKTGKHPGIKATVTQKGIPEAGIAKAEVRLPKSLALDIDNAQALCEYEDGTKPDLENHCPKGSIVGRSRAVSPLLNDPLVGNVYFVKNVRRSSSGNLIRTLPMIVVALRGEIAINLVGESNVKKGKLVNTFDQVPDAPITRFNLNINGGKNGIIAVTRTRRSLINLCSSRRQIAEADIDGHNGRRHDQDIRMKTPCGKKTNKTKAQKRKAAAKRRATRR